MRPGKKRRRLSKARTKSNRSSSSSNLRLLRFQTLESRQLLAGDVGLDPTPLADITGMWVTVGDREYFTSEQASVSIDMYQGETLQVTGIQYRMGDTATPEDGVVAFESYVRREHGAAEIGSYDYTDGRFGDPVDETVAGGQSVSHPGLDGGWQLDLIDNRVAVVAIRYFGNESVVEDRMYIDLNVTPSVESTAWTESISPVTGTWDVTQDELAGNSLDAAAGLTVIETGTVTSGRYEIGVKAKTVQEHTFANGFVVVDYKNENDFVYAGLRLTDNQWVIGHFDGAFNDLATLTEDIQPRQVYDLRVAIDGTKVALAADGVMRVKHDFARPLDQGDVGLANQYAYTHFTEFHVFDNSDTLAPEPQQAYDEAVTAANLANEAAAAAADLADQTAAAGDAAEINAVALESASAQADAAVAEAVAAHADVTAAVTESLSTIELASSTIDAAMLDQQSAADSLGSLTVALADAEANVVDLIQQHEQALQSLGDLPQLYADATQNADAAVAASNDAEATAASARRAADEADALVEASADEKKSIRRAVEKAARKANQAAQNAEVAAQEAAEIAAAALEELQQISDELAAAQSVADQIDQSLSDAQQSVASIEQSIDDTRVTLDAATLSIQENQAALDAAELQLPELQAQQDLLAQQVTDTSAAAESATHAAADARAEADFAATDAEASAAEALRLNQEADAANQVLVAAELALQEAIAAEQAAIENGDTSLVYSVNFNNQDDGAFETVSGVSDRLAGQLHLSPGENGLAIAVLDQSALPDRTATRMYATVRADALPGLENNGFIVFDYHSPTDFKFTGADATGDRWVLGEFVDGQRIDVAALDEIIGEGPAYEMQAWIENNTLTLLVEGQQKLQHTFDGPIDDGQIGVATEGAQSRFDQVAVMRLFGGAGDAGIDTPSDPASTDAAINELF